MADMKSKYIDNATYVISFNPDENMRLRQADAEKAFGAMFPNVQSIQTNVPDGYDPNAPRFIIQTAKKILTISQVAAQFILKFEYSSKSLQEQLGIIEKNISTFVSAIKEFTKANIIEQQGFIVSVNYKTNLTQQEMSDYLFKHFFNFKPYGEPVSTNFTIGFKISDLLFLNLGASSYEIRETSIEKGASKMVRVDTIPVKEVGYNLKVDINNRPMFLTANQSLSIISVSETIKKQMRNTIENEIDNFMGFTIEG